MPFNYEVEKKKKSELTKRSLALKNPQILGEIGNPNFRIESKIVLFPGWMGGTDAKDILGLRKTPLHEKKARPQKESHRKPDGISRERIDFSVELGLLILCGLC